jgi:hypothetical protein
MRTWTKKRKWITLAVCVLALAGVVAYATGEIKVTALLQVENGQFSLTRKVSNYSVDQTGVAFDYGIQSVAVGSTNALNIANVSTPGYCFFRNLDATNDIYVTLTVKLRAGDTAVLPVAGTNMTVYSTAGTNNLEYWVNEE